MPKFYQNYSVTSSDIVTICICMQSHNISTDSVLLKKQINRITIKKITKKFACGVNVVLGQCQK